MPGGILLNPGASGSGDCCCSGGTCTVHLVACNGSAGLAGATVTIKDSGGATLDSGTTDSGGNFASTAGCGSNRTVVIAATGYVTTTLTGQTLSSTPLTINMASHMDTANYALCCGNCPFPRTVHYSWINGATSGSGTATFVALGVNVWHVGVADFACVNGLPVLQLHYDDPDGGATISCNFLATSFTCNPFNVVFGPPTEEECPRNPLASNFSETITA